jgi:hypothetical protein
MFSSKMMSILVLVSVVCFAVLIGLQFWELSHYGAAPSVWPASP